MFDWTKLWDVGEHLKDFSREEEYQRSAVGRYYYSCYLLARDFYNKKSNREIGEKICHQCLIDKFKNSENKTERIIGEYLEELFDYRKTADYEIEFDVELNKAKRISNNVLSCLKKLNNKK